MKKNFLVLLIALFAFGWTGSLFGQYDDLYYDPDLDGDYYFKSSFNKGKNNDRDYYDDYDDYDEYSYHYSSRIRRFHRPFIGFGYYDPCYVDLYYYNAISYYDPFWSPGINYLIYDNPFSYRRGLSWAFGWNAWRGPYVSFSYNYNPWRNHWYSPWNRSYYDPWYYGHNTYVVNNYYGGGWYGGGYYNNYYSNNYYSPTWGGSNSYNTGSNNTYYGARRVGNSDPSFREGRNPMANPVETGPTTVDKSREGMGSNPSAVGSREAERNATRAAINENRRINRDGPTTQPENIRTEDRSVNSPRPSRSTGVTGDEFREPVRTPRTTEPTRSEDSGIMERYDRSRTQPQRQNQNYERSNNTQNNHTYERSQNENRRYTPAPNYDRTLNNTRTERTYERATPPRTNKSSIERSNPPRSNSGGIERSTPQRSNSGGIERSTPQRSNSGSIERSAPQRSNSGGIERSSPPRTNNSGGTIERSNSGSSRGNETRSSRGGDEAPRPSSDTSRGG